MPRKAYLYALLLLVAVGLGLLTWQWSNARDPLNVLKRAEAALKNRDFVQAGKLADRLQSAGATSHATYLQARILIERDRWDDAWKLLQTLEDDQDVRLLVWGQQGRCKLQFRDPLAALADFNKVLQQDPGDVTAHRGAFEVHYSTGNVNAALAHAEKWAELEPQDGLPPRWIGFLLLEQEQFADAEKAFTQALSRTLTDAVRKEVMLEIAETHIGRKQFQQALDRLANIPMIEPPTTDLDKKLLAEVYALRAVARASMGAGNYPQATEDADKALSYDGKSATALKVRGQLCLHQEQFEQSIKYLEPAEQLAAITDRAEIATGLSQAYAALGRTEDATKARKRVEEMNALFGQLADLTRAVIQRPTDPDLHQQLADRYRRLGMTHLVERHQRAATVFRAAPKKS